MKKYFILILIIHAITNSCICQIKEQIQFNGIDSLANTAQVIEFVHKSDVDFYFSGKIKYYDDKLQKIFDSLQIKTWSKADFDNNRLTDLLVMSDDGNSILCILDKGGKFELNYLYNHRPSIFYFPLIKENVINCCICEIPDLFINESPEIRNLYSRNYIYKYGGFVEENLNASKHKIESINFSTSECYGTCPAFDLSVNSNRKANWKAISYNEINNIEVKGKFRSKITIDKYRELINLLNYIDFEKLDYSYSIGATDNPRSSLKIKYDNGKCKVIFDYGLQGTFGLIQIYKLLFELRENQKWVKLKNN